MLSLSGIVIVCVCVFVCGFMYYVFAVGVSVCTHRAVVGDRVLALVGASVGRCDGRCCCECVSFTATLSRSITKPSSSSANDAVAAAMLHAAESDGGACRRAAVV